MKGVLCAPCAAYYNGAVSQKSAQDTLIHLNTLNLAEQYLSGISADDAYFYENALVGYAEFRRFEVKE